MTEITKAQDAISAEVADSTWLSGFEAFNNKLPDTYRYVYCNVHKVWWSKFWYKRCWRCYER